MLKDKQIIKKIIRERYPRIRGILFLCLVILFFLPQKSAAQVISNTGASISTTSGVFVNSKDYENTTGALVNSGTLTLTGHFSNNGATGSFINDGTLNLTGNYFNAGSSGGNGLFNLTSNWTNLGSFNPGTSTVSFNGIANQTITHGSTGENFYKLTFNNAGNSLTQIANPGSSLTVSDDLTIITGTLILDPTTSNLIVGGRATITSAGSTLLFNNSTTQTASIGNILSGSGTIDMSGGNFPHVLNLAGSANSIGTFSTSPTSSSTVNYNGATQTVFSANNYRNLFISNSGVKTLQGNSVVNLRLIITDGTFDLGAITTLNVQHSTTINGSGSLSFNGTSTKTVILNDSLTGTGSIDMSGGDLPHLLNLYGPINSIGSFSTSIAGSSTVDYIAPGDQTVFTSNNYRNLRITGGGVKTLNSDISASGTLIMLNGDINSNGNTLSITNGVVSAINRTAGKIIGKLRRAIGTTGSQYLYPVGSATSYNPLQMQFQNLAPGLVTAQFKPQDIGWTGPPLDDNGNEIYDRIPTGYWTLTSFTPFTSNNFNVKLDYTGFPTGVSGVNYSSRIFKRTDGGTPELDGTHDTVNYTTKNISRNTLLNGISPVTTDFAIAKGRPKIVTQPSNIDICEGSNATFQVKATGQGLLTYQWEVYTGSGSYTPITNGGVYSGALTNTLTITGAPYGMNGYLYRCIITDAQLNTNVTLPALLTVNKIPIAIANIYAQNECSGVAFSDIVFGTSNSVSGTTFNFTRTNPSGIITSIPTSGPASGGIISGIFSNSNDFPVTVTFTIVPTGPLTTFCVGLPITVNVTVNPIPKVTSLPASSTQCDSTTTSIQLQSPSTFTSGVISFNYAWSVSTTGSVTGFNPSTTGLPNNYTITDKLFNHTDVFQVVTYNVVPLSPVGCAPGPSINVPVTVNPTPRATPYNMTNFKPDSSICFGGTTNIVLTSPTVMATGWGNVIFDYNVSATGGPGFVTGDMSSASNKIPNYKIIRSYQNISDTLQSVYYSITPKLDNAICNKGPVFKSQIRVHPQPNRRILIVKPLTCEGGSDATLSAVTSKGVTPFKYLWQEPFHAPDTILTITNKIGGIYRLTITDNLGCNNSRDTVVQGALINSYLQAIPKNPNYDITCPGYNDGELWAQVISGGTPVYEYWIARNSQDTSIAIHGFFNSTGQWAKYYNLYAGDYQLFIKDANGCFDNSSTFPINEPAPITVTFGRKQYSGGFNVSCKTYSDGKAWIKTISGGNGGYSYQWTNSGGTIIGTSDTISGLIAGKYYLHTVDSLACTKLDSVMITEPNGMGLSSVLLKTSPDGNYNVSCNGYSDGEITLNITGGSGTYQYHWSGPGGNTTTSVNKISGLSAGHYTAIVSDVNGCTLAALDTVLVQPTMLNVVSARSLAPDNINNIACFGGTGWIDLTVTGGSIGNYAYNWSALSNGSGILSGQKDQPALTFGTYRVVVSDTNKCSATRDIQLTQPQALVTTLIPTHITCFPAGFSNGSINLTVTGGMAPYIYNWSNGATSEDISGLTQGYYKIKVTDINVCQKTDSVKINLPPNLTYTSAIKSFNSFNISCFGSSDGEIDITPLTGKPPYNYSWSGLGGSFVSVNKNIIGLKAGQYILQITDSNQCISTGTFNLSQPGKLSMIIDPSHSALGGFNINCAGASTGSINVNPVNNVGAVKYLWSDGATGYARNNLTSGKYKVIVTDQNNCQADSTVILTQPDSIKITFNIKQAFCPDSPDGVINLKVTGGVIISDYAYRWSDNSTTQNLSNILKGIYKVTVTDGNDCSVRDSVKMEPLNKTCLLIPNAISPNGDNINDVWNIGNINLYPQIEIRIYNRWGELIWRSEKGYPQPWDGRSNGILLPIDSYHYVIDLHNGSNPIIGNITIVR
jgi:gliding motility-associated-like protein